MHAAFEEVMQSSPAGIPGPRDALVRCVEACSGCELACLACADACLSEEHIGMLRRCIRLNHACADICAMTARLLPRAELSSGVLRAQLEVCAAICEECQAECAQHGKMHSHCASCAEMCERCAKACHEVLRSLASS
jgi:hypothetical protein